MKTNFVVLVLFSFFFISCAVVPPTPIIEDGVSLTTFSLGDRDLVLVESVDRTQTLVSIRCGGLVTAGFCDKCVRGQIRDMEQNKPVRDCRDACKTDNCQPSAIEHQKVLIPKKYVRVD